MIVKILKSADIYEEGELLKATNHIWDIPKECWKIATAGDIAEFIRGCDSYDESMEDICTEFCDMAGIDFSSYDEPWEPLEKAADKLGVEIY